MLSVALRHRFADFTLDAAFEAPDGLTALFGHSGSGKTTVVNAVAGLLRPHFACITDGDAVLTDSEGGIFLPPHRRGIGYVFQDARLFPHMTVTANLRYSARWRRDAARDFDRVVQMVGLGALLNRRPATLSGGERQRAALARAVIMSPDLVIADEPTGNLDWDMSMRLLQLLIELNRSGKAVLFATHDMNLIRAAKQQVQARVLRIAGKRLQLAGADL